MQHKNKHFRIKEKKNDIFFTLVLALASFAFMSVFSYYTSPFAAHDNGADSAFFCLVGKGMTKGLLPYRDFYDMKGPFLFFIEYLGQLLSYGRTGIFTIQCINLFLSLVIISKIFDYYHIKNRLVQVVLMLPLAYVASFTFEGGNLTEEFSLVPLLSCLYICLAFLNNSENTSKFWKQSIFLYAGACFGFCFGLLLMIRVTNAALICAMVLTVVIVLVKSKKFHQLFICAGMFLAGLAVSVIPAVVYYGANGLLDEMYGAVFVLGFRYSGEQSLLQHMKELKFVHSFLIFVPCVIILLLRWKSWKERLLAVFAALFTFVAIASGNAYLHYYTLTIPLLVIGEIPVADLFCSKKIERERERERENGARLLRFFCWQLC